jgi:tetratricopeptide (TPR) repeat protein
LALTIKTEAGDAVPDAAVTIRADAGEPFTIQGTTDKKGRYLTKLPDFSRAYRFAVTKASFVPFEQAVDLSTQNLAPGKTAELTITMLEDRGPTPEMLFNEGVKAIQASNFALGEEKMKAALALKPDMAQAWSVMTILAVEGKRWTEAVENADKTLALAPGDLAALRARPEALAALGRKEEEAAALDQLAALDHSPDAARMLFNSGAAAWSAKNAELATRRFEQALAASPALYQAHSALAEVKIGTKDLPGALAELEKAIEKAPTEAKIWRRKVEVLKALGKTEEAAAAEKKLAELGG